MGLLSNAAESNQGDSVRPFAPWELPIEKHLTAVMAAPGSQSGGDPGIHERAARRLTPSYLYQRPLHIEIKSAAAPYPRSFSCAVAARRK